MKENFIYEIFAEWRGQMNVLEQREAKIRSTS